MSPSASDRYRLFQRVDSETETVISVADAVYLSPIECCVFAM